MDRAKQMQRAELCFRLANHPTATEGERAAAKARGEAILSKLGVSRSQLQSPSQALQPNAGISSDWSATVRSARTEFARHHAREMKACISCGRTHFSRGVCGACLAEAAEKVCPHGAHGFCIQCSPELAEEAA